MLDHMRKSGKIVADIFEKLLYFVKSSISTEDIDNYVTELIKKSNCISGALNYKGFPKSCCISVNHEVCHGIPNKYKILKSGDLVSIDIALSHNNYFGDSCVTFGINKLLPMSEKLLNVAYNSMWSAISIVKPGICIYELGKAMENYANSFGCTTVREFCGHGIGQNMHEDPYIPFYYDKNYNEVLKEGMFITIEPMVNAGSSSIRILNDGWTAVTKDGLNSVQFEHTIYIGHNGYEVMTYNFFDKLNHKLKSNIR